MLLTIGLESWAVDLKDVGAIYPFQGLEYPMVIAGLVFWVLWHLWQLRNESRELSASVDVDNQKATAAIDEY